MRRIFLLALGLLLASVVMADDVVVLRMMAAPSFGIPAQEATDPRSLARRAVFEEFHRQNPDIRVVNAGGLEMVGDRADSTFLMSMAGDTAPDVFYVNFRQYYNFIDQGFCRPLDDLIARTPGALDRVNPIILDVLRTYDGQIYAVPFFQVAMALYYRRDHFREAGLDPNRPPRDWEEFYQYAQQLTRPELGRSGFAFSAGIGGKAYHWSNFVWQAGGDIIAVDADGTTRTVVDSPEGAVALDFFRRLTTERWEREGRLIGPAASVSATYGQDVAAGRVSMWFNYTNDVVLNLSDINPALLGVAALPAGPAGRANEINAGMWAINSAIDNDPRKLEAAWRFIQFFTGPEAARINTERFVELGLGNLVSPALLEEFGFDDIVAQVDPSFVAANRELFLTGHPEPFGRNVQQVYTVLDSALDRAMLERTPSIDILRQTAREMDRVMLGYTPPEELAVQRRWAMGVVILFALGALATAGVGVRKFWHFQQERRADPYRAEKARLGRNKLNIYGFVTWCLIPASLSLLVWAYYPLARGLVIAFQDYRLVTETRWVGLDNFIAVFTQPIFWKSLWNSFIYVSLTLIIGFFIPIFLALGLNEITRFRVFFRTVFYLPAMTSPIVIAFLWRQFYDKSETGFLNTVVQPIVPILDPFLGWLSSGMVQYPYDWLGDPRLAMFAVVLPGVWAGAGPGSILYLAALKNIPGERYEAADLDGASWWHKIRWITLPGLKPLILINLLGVFIAGFKAMENIFVLTGGGPLYATHTIGLEVWTNAFMFLKFGYATAAAWVMGAILIGFTIIQIRSLMKMKFTAAKI